MYIERSLLAEPSILIGITSFGQMRYNKIDRKMCFIAKEFEIKVPSLYP
jgi:hypothetical protein